MFPASADVEAQDCTGVTGERHCPRYDVSQRRLIASCTAMTVASYACSLPCVEPAGGARVEMSQQAMLIASIHPQFHIELLYAR